MINDIGLCQPRFQARERLRVCWSFISSQVNIGGCSCKKQLPFASSQRFLEQQEFAGKSQGSKQISTVQSNAGHLCCESGNLLIALREWDQQLIEAQLHPLQRHVARPGSASAGERYNIATFDVIPAGSSSDVCPDGRLRTVSPLPGRADTLCNAKTDFTEESGITMPGGRSAQHPRIWPLVCRNGKRLAMKWVQASSKSC